ncbi:MAG: WD40 repeat domain-containing protein [Anaerolineae bacterium]
MKTIVRIEGGNMKPALLLVCFGILFFAACGPAPTATPVAVLPTAAPTVIASATPILAPTLTPTAPPTPTLTVPLAPTAEPTSIPTQTPTPTDTPEPTAAPTNTPEPTATPKSKVALHQVAELRTGASTLAFSPDDRLLAVANGGDVVVWDTASWSQRWTASHDDSVRKIAFSPDGQRLASVSFDNTARLWDVATGNQVAQLDYGYWVYGLDFSSDSQRLATGGFDGKVIIADATTGQPINEFKHQLMVQDLALSPNGPWLAVMTSGSWGPVELVVWDIFTHERRTLAEFNGLPSHSNVVFSPDTKWLAAAMSFGAPVTIWETKIWPEVAHLEISDGVIKQLAFSPDGRWLAGVVFKGETDNKVLVWEVPAWRVVSQMEQADVVWDVAFSPDGQWLVTGLGQGIEHPPAYEGQLWETASGTLVARMPHARQVLAVAFSHDGKRIATGSYDQAKIWEFQSSTGD